jgi:hypothetical protein
MGEQPILCIVPARGAAAAKQRGGTDPIFLPFEGDATLSVILSKASCCEDTAITDPTITRQLALR